jgi:DNA polymerase-3 subunit alpha
MAAVLSRNLSDITKVTFFMDECRAMGLEVAGPDVNASYRNFTVDKKGVIRFGMQGIKGVGGAAVDNIIEERDKNGEYKDIFDFVKRVKLTSVNKKNIEALAYAGAFDGFEGITREQFFAEEDGRTFIEKIISFGNSFQTQSSDNSLSLFGGENEVTVANPVPPVTEEWSTIAKLEKERDHIGVYLSAHPLDEFRYEIEHGGFVPLKDMMDLSEREGQDIKICGFVTNVEHTFDKNNNPVGFMTVEDFSGSYRVRVSARDGYLDMKGYFTKDIVLFISGKVVKWAPEGRDAMFFFNPKVMDLMSNKKENVLKSILLKIKLDNLDSNLIHSLHDIIQAHSGKVKLNFLIWDDESNTEVPMHSKSFTVGINKEFIGKLNALENLEYFINK